MRMVKITYRSKCFSTIVRYRDCECKVILDHEVYTTTILTKTISRFDLTFEVHLNVYTIAWDGMSVTFIRHRCSVLIKLAEIEVNI